MAYLLAGFNDHRSADSRGANAFSGASQPRAVAAARYQAVGGQDRDDRRSTHVISITAVTSRRLRETGRGRRHTSCGVCGR